jgi:hypothetical protein
VTNVYIDNLSQTKAQELFNLFADKHYLSNAECNLNGHGSSSSVRLEMGSHDRYIFLSDLADFFYDEPR